MSARLVVCRALDESRVDRRYMVVVTCCHRPVFYAPSKAAALRLARTHVEDKHTYRQDVLFGEPAA